MSALTIEVGKSTRVSGLLHMPAQPLACYVFAHGAGAGMDHPSMSVVAQDLAMLGIATLRYQFPYMQNRSKRPDPPAVCHATVRAAVAEAAGLAPGIPLFAGGRSFGGRMTSQAQALSPLPGVKGLVFLAFPLHQAKKPSTERAKHLFDIRIPMLFLQGTRDALASIELLEPVVGQLGVGVTLHLATDADHSFHVPARTGRNDADVRREILERATEWMRSVIAGD